MTDQNSTDQNSADASGNDNGGPGNGGTGRTALERNAGTDGEDLQRHITETVWGSVWTRDGLEKRDRSLLNIGMLVALRATGELRGHVRGGLRNGLTREEITEAVIHTAGYCGAPAALSARKVVQEVLVEELGPLGESGAQ